MKKSILSLLVATMWATAAFAQVTPEAILGLRPDYTPTIPQCVEYAVHNTGPVKDFVESIDKGVASAEESLAKSTGNVEMHARNDAKKVARELGVKDIKDLEHMTPAQAKKFAMEQARKRMAKSGVDMSKVHKNMSEKEIRELANQAMAQQTGGLTVDDMEFITNNHLNAKETVDFMKAAGIYESVQEKLKSNKSKLTPAQRKVMDEFQKAVTPLKVFQENFARKLAVIAEHEKEFEAEKQSWREKPEMLTVEVQTALATKVATTLQPLYLDLAAYAKINMPLFEKYDKMAEVSNEVLGYETYKSLGRLGKSTVDLAIQYLNFTKRAVDFSTFIPF